MQAIERSRRLGPRPPAISRQSWPAISSPTTRRKAADRCAGGKAYPCASDGDLHAVSVALIGLPQIWSEPLTKVKTPNELVLSACRAFGVTDATAGEGIS